MSPLYFLFGCQTIFLGFDSILHLPDDINNSGVCS